MKNFYQRLFRLVSCPSRRAGKNLEANRSLEHLLPSGCLNGQGMGAVSRFRLGLSRYGFSGCEVIAVYNACQLADKPLPLSRVGYLCECQSLPMLGGFWGTDPFRLDRLLTACGLEAKRLTEAEAKEAEGVLVLSFWNRRGSVRKGIHTVTVRCRKGHCRVYNRYNNTPVPQLYPDLTAAIGEGQFLTAYLIT